jgi:hypothetical protein
MPNRIRFGRREPIIVEEERYIVHEDNSIASGLLLGIIIAVILGIIGAAFLFTHQRQPTLIRAVPDVLPNTTQPQNNHTNQSQINSTTTTQRTETTRTVVPAPTVNLNLPNNQKTPNKSTSGNQ